MLGNAKQINNPQHNRLYVVGYGRSGTTIIMEILNSSDEIFLFSELNLHVLRRNTEAFVKYGGNNFIEHYAERKKMELTYGSKGAIPPAPAVLDYRHAIPSPDEYIDTVGKPYRYIGDKIATAHRMWDGVADIDILEEFLEKEEKEDAIIIYTLRRPSENLLSVSKMIPDADIRSWGRSIAEAMIVVIKSFVRSSNSYLVFHEDIGRSLIPELSNLLVVDLPFNPELVGASHQMTRGHSMPSAEPWVEDLDALYKVLYELFRSDSVLKCARTDEKIREMTMIIDSIRAIVARV